MLKVRIAAEPGGVEVLNLEGRLRGEWVDELRHMYSAQKRRSGRVVVDASQVTFADEEGLRLLHEIVDDGVELRGCSLFLQALMDGKTRGHSAPAALIQPASTEDKT